MAATVYLDRDNPIRLQLLQDKSVVAANAVTKAALHVPAQAFADGVAVTYDTTGPYLTLEESSTVLVIELGGAPIKPGFYVCLLTLYDATSPDGLAWEEVTVRFREWAA